MNDMEKAMQAIWAVEKGAPDPQTARERLLEIAVEARYRADHVRDGR